LSNSTFLADRAREIAQALLGMPNKALSTAAQLRYGTNGSLAIEIAGDKAGAWYDHETEEGGCPLDLVMRERGCDKTGALAWLRSDLGIETKGGNGAAEPQRRVAVYVYKDEQGQPLYCVVRWGPLKTFTQHRYDPDTGKFIPGKGSMQGVELVPYRLPELLASDGRCWITEGEKDADRLAGLGLIATTNPGGAGKWPAGFARYFTGRDVVILPDNDSAGRDHALLVKASLGAVAASVRIAPLPGLLPKQDVSNWLDHGHTVADLERLLAAADQRGGDQRGDVATEAKAARLAVGGAALLDDVRAFLLRFVSYPSADACVAHVLWIGHAHLMEAWESTPRIAFLSPEPASGKTRALEVTELLVPRPVEAVNVSPAYLFRRVAADDGAPTILFDEIDTLFGPKARDNEEIRGLLNAGHRRGAVTGRCVVRGKIVETEEIPAYCAVALAGLGWLPETLMTRAVVIRMRPRSPAERIEPYRRRVHCADGMALRARLERWAIKALDVVSDTWPEMPAGVQDRDADVWEALLACADAAGGDWPGRARAAAVTLVTEVRDSTPSLGVRLLADLRTIFDQRDAMRTTDILNALIALDEAPWADLRGKPLNARGLGVRLRQYGINRTVVRFGVETARGYERAAFTDAWSRYLGAQAEESVTSVTSVTDAPKATATADANVTDCVTDVTDGEAGSVTPEARDSANVTDVTDVTDLWRTHEQCAICTGTVVRGDRIEEDGKVMHPICAMAMRQS
jgi:Protein of unknown function (DUF3631)